MNSKRHQLPAFRRFEPFIHEIIRSHPTPITFSPSPLGPETFVGRLRDALNGFIFHNHPTELFTTDQALQVFNCLSPTGDFVITHDLTNVTCAPRKTRHRVLQEFTPQQPTTLQHPTDSQVNAATHPDIVLAYATLKHYEHILTPIEVTNLSTTLRDQITNQFPNVELIDESTHTLLI